MRFAIRPAVRLPKFPLGTDTISRYACPAALRPAWLAGQARQQEVVEHLRQQPAEIDRVGRASATPCFRSSSSANACLTRRWQSSNVPLTATAVMLPPRDAICASWTSVTCPSGYSTNTRESGHAVERLRDGAAGVAGGRHKNRQRRPVREVMQQTGLHARADVLERQRRAVEQLERPDAIGHLDERNRKVERITDEPAHVLLGDVAGQQVRADDRADLGELGVLSALETPRGSGSNRSGKVQAAVRRRAGEQRVDERHRRRRRAWCSPISSVHRRTYSVTFSTNAFAPSHLHTLQLLAMPASARAGSAPAGPDRRPPPARPPPRSP